MTNAKKYAQVGGNPHSLVTYVHTNVRIYVVGVRLGGAATNQRTVAGKVFAGNGKTAAFLP